MTDENNAPIVVTLKGGEGYAAPWLVIRGDNPDQVTSMLRNLGELPGAVVEAANLFSAANVAGPMLANAPQAAPTPTVAPVAPVVTGPWGQQPPAAPAQQQQYQPPAPTGGPQAGQPHPEGHTCQTCGALLTYWETKTGKGQFKCPQYRYSSQTRSGNGHTIEWL